MCDILVEVPDEYLPKLAELYKKKASWAPHMFSFIETGLKWKKSEKFCDAITFLSPYNSWEQDGTIIVIIKVIKSQQDIVVFTLDEKSTRLYEGLMKTSLIDFTLDRILFFAVHEKHAPIVKNFLKEVQNCIPFDISCFIYAISPEEAKNFTLECSSEVHIKKIDHSMAEQINNVWPHKFLRSDQYIAKYLEINGGYGVFLKNTNRMVSWVIKQTFGHLAMLQTEEDYKRRGYASLVVKALSKEIAKDGHWPVGTILVNNKKSIDMFEKLGFRCIGKCNFIGIERE